MGGSISSGSSASSVTVTRSYRGVGGSGGGSFGDSLVTRSYLLGNSRLRTQVSCPSASTPPQAAGPWSLRVRVALWGESLLFRSPGEWEPPPRSPRS